MSWNRYGRGDRRRVVFEQDTITIRLLKKDPA